MKEARGKEQIARYYDMKRTKIVWVVGASHREIVPPSRWQTKKQVPKGRLSFIVTWSARNVVSVVESISRASFSKPRTSTSKQT
jgi:hypothetical protein